MMRILLQDKTSSEFLTKTGWSVDVKEAWDFREVPKAVQHAVQNNLTGVRLVCDFSEQFGHERWNARFELRTGGEVVEEGKFKNRRVVYPEKQTGQFQKL